MLKIKLEKMGPFLCSAITIICVVSFIFVSIFLYNNFYSTISKTKKILILQEKVANEVLDINKFNKVIESLEKKVSDDS
ncbi:MAG: hypothetical protein ABIA02_01320 [Candidatus Falkowbacteria bacterium]